MFDRNAWERANHAKRRQQLITHLGGVCVNCGSDADLQFDHVDASTKERDVSHLFTQRWEVILKEADKCQLLCTPCHREKTRINNEHGGGHNRWSEIQHGTAHAYNKYKCRCDPCRVASALAKGRKPPVRRPQPAVHGSVSMYSYHQCRCDTCKEGQRLRLKAWRARSSSRH